MKIFRKRASTDPNIAGFVDVTAMNVDRHGRVNHAFPEELSNDELLDVAQLNGAPLANNLGMEIAKRGLASQLSDLLQRQLEIPNH